MTFSRFVARLFGFLLLFAFVGLVGSCLITLAIWPGELKLLAPIFCTDAQPDAFVVADTTNPRPGETATSFTLYCMGPRGDSTDVGFLEPFLMISVVNGLVLMIPIVVAAIAFGRWLRRSGGELRASTENAPPDGTGRRVENTDADRDRGEQSDVAARARRDRPSPPPGSTPGPFVS